MAPHPTESSSGLPSGRGAAVQAERRRGWGALAVLAPHVLLGTWLLLVPDRLAFTASQLVVLAHVAVGLLTLPLFGYWLWAHARRRGEKRRRARETAVSIAVRRLVAATAIAGFATGLYVAWSGRVGGFSAVHGWLGVAVALPLALHLALERRRLAASLVLLAFAAGLGGSLAAVKTLPPKPERVPPPPFDYRMRPVGMYEPADWCGRCHAAIYDEWRHTTHARALRLPSVRRDFGRTIDERGRGFLDADLAGARDSAGSSALCVRCHAPLTFFGDDPTPVLSAGAPILDGVSCTFCHTLRRPSATGPGTPAPLAWLRALVERMRGARGSGPEDDPSFYTSAPETVRRYLGQGSSSPPLRRIGDWLIRWRPEVHRRDYHVPYLEGSEACALCHHKPFETWQHSRYNTGDPRTSTNCQDCHMVRDGAMTGEPVREPGRLVPWGPVRPQRRTHLFLGGNSQAALQLGDREMPVHERAFARGGASVRVDGTRLDGARLEATVTVAAEHIGHRFPTGEAAARFAWIKVSALAGDGAVLASTPRPASGSDRAATSPILFDPSASPGHGLPDTALDPDGERAFPARLDLGPAAARAARVRAELYLSFDDEQPIATAERALR